MSTTQSDMDDIEPLLSRDEQIIVIGATPPKARIYPQLLATLIVCLAPLSMGMALGFSSPTVVYLKQLDILKTKDEVAWYGSLLTVGAIAGGPIAGFAAEKLGRKTTIIMCALPFAAGWLMIIMAKSVILLFCGRVMTGIATGMCSLATPMYIAEISTKQMRGTLVSGFQLSVTVGILLVYMLGIPCNRQWLAVACSAIAALLAVATLFVPETPKWLLSCRLRTKGLTAIRWLRGVEFDIEEECLEIEANLQSQVQQVGIREMCCRSSLLKPLVISMGLMLFQQCSGINVFIFYTAQIFKSSGYASNAHMPTIIIGVVQVAATFLACILMDIAGRKILLICSGIIMVISCTTFGLYYYLTDVKQIEGLSWLSLTSLVVFIIAFSLSWGPIPWLVMSEIFPANARGLASSLATICNWTCAFLVTSQFHRLQDAVHQYGAMWSFAGMTLLGVIFVAVCLPETKGKSLEEIQEHFESDS